MEKEEHFFDFAAEVGLTKHLGGVEATQKLIDLCHIAEGKHILDVGCGAGTTSSFIAKRYGCRVIGVDIHEGMVARSREMAERVGVTNLTQFRVADVQDLPFEDALFDAVISESVTAFPENKGKAVDEYVRVTKPGGYIGLNESTWLKVPPPPEMVAWVAQDVGATVMPLTSDEWVSLLEDAGLSEVVVRMYNVNVREEVRGLFKRYGLGGMLRIYRKTLSLYIRNPTYRSFVKSVRQGGIAPEGLDEYFGFGIYVGRKAH
ncbi:MAG: class I SAM-dependent methyltransferase [Anaerolineales bacterium]|jgi:cyclopropane fatty-acyl-phospholipid synthase-like methyltransferase